LLTETQCVKLPNEIVQNLFKYVQKLPSTETELFKMCVNINKMCQAPKQINMCENMYTFGNTYENCVKHIISAMLIEKNRYCGKRE